MIDEVSILKVKNLEAGYGNITILKSVNISLSKGEVLGVIGENGSGKSTLLKTLSGLLPKQAGEIWFRNEPFNIKEPHKLVSRGISYFVQGGLIMPSLTVQEHLELTAMQSGRKFQNTFFDSVYAEFPKLRTMENQRAGNLSGGEKQVLTFGMLLIQNTATWLLDEPTSGLAPEMVSFSIDFLKRKNKEGITMLLVEHNMNVAFSLATHIVIAKDRSVTSKFNESVFKAKDFLDKNVYN
jgi:branched-chain amino acid transport system ATP-binding protein